MIIRVEEPRDWQEVEMLIREAFWNVYRPGCQEHFVLKEYRSNPAFIPELDFVMEEDGRIIGLKLLQYALEKASLSPHLYCIIGVHNHIQNHHKDKSKGKEDCAVV